ncbi:MAG: BC1881 family protein [Ruminococcus sp.]|nr:BC1881 family protein [Ruminococcus sp.]
MKIEEIPTCQLVEELKKREGVETIIVEPDEGVIVCESGPAIILKVID